MPPETIRRRTSPKARVLLLADTHLGFDLPMNPRVERRRRGHDFFANYHRALQPAIRGEVDLLVHGGDLFDRSPATGRSKAADWLVERAIEPLIRIADSGVPVFMVPGNHERSRLPLHLWMCHPQMHVFDRPRTYTRQVDGGTIALSGFPFERRARTEFKRLVRMSGWDRSSADAHLLCIHQAVEGAQVGVHNYTFRNGADVVRTADIPDGLTAVLSGHIHRAQTLHHDLVWNVLSAPVVYPGSIERTSFAERREEKGYTILEVPLNGNATGLQSDDGLQITFVPLPSRPMVYLEMPGPHGDTRKWRQQLKRRLDTLPSDAIVRLQIEGGDGQGAAPILTAQQLRDLAPGTMNVAMPRSPRRRGKEGAADA